MTRPFYKPEPTKPENSKVARALNWSLRIEVIGWATYGLFAFAFADLGVIPAWLQSSLVLLGSAMIVIGAETNTIPTLTAALSKVGTGRFDWWDVSAVLASLVGSLCSALITFSTRQTELSGTAWREFAVVKGPLVLGFAATLDLYGAAAEAAFIKRDYSRDWAAWWEEKLAWDERYDIIEPQPAPPKLTFDPSWPEANLSTVLTLTSHLNGERPTFNRNQLLKILHDNQCRPKSDSTVTRWVQKVKAAK